MNVRFALVVWFIICSVVSCVRSSEEVVNDREAVMLHDSVSCFEHLVLVKSVSDESVEILPDLRGRVVRVLAKSLAYDRALSLNEEIGGGIVVEVMPDTCTELDLLNYVAELKGRYAILSSGVMELYKEWYPYLDARQSVTFPYVCERRQDVVFDEEYKQDSISPYDVYFKRYASLIGWDWRLLAALAYHESRFKNMPISPRGAMGVMQLMPITAVAFGLDSISVCDPELNIKAGTHYLKYLQRVYKEIDDVDERNKFMLASYNAGPAHIIDAMDLAEKYGRDPHRWFGSVEYYLKRKHEEEIYLDSIVNFGYFNSREPVDHVRKILKTYEQYLRY